MDTDWTTGQVARELGVSVPRVLRAARGGLVPAGRRGNRTVLPAQSVESLRRRWGSVPRLDGLTREEALVLVALSRRPLGLRSARAAAQDAGVSPTTAARALRRLRELGYVERTALGGSDGTDDVWRVRVGRPPWSHTAGRLARARLPAPRGTSSPATAFPSRLLHLFWNVEPGQLDLERDAVFVARRLLESDDPEAWAWLAGSVEPRAIREAAGARGLDPARVALALAIADAA